MSGQEKDKGAGYWQAIANYDYALDCFNAMLGFDDAGVATAIEMFEHGEDHPEHGHFFTSLVEIQEVISKTYNVPNEEVDDDIDAFAEMSQMFKDIIAYNDYT